MKNKITINCHSSIRVQGEKTVYFDPYNIEKESHDADIIFITHNHYDHYDPDSINKLKKKDTIIVMPNNCIRKLISEEKDLKQYIGVNPKEQYFIKGININTVESYNMDKDFHPRNNEWVGYVITMNDEIIYVSGDTDALEDNQKIKCDIALIPIGGTFTMDIEEAAKFVNNLKPKYVIPTHYGSIVGKLTDGEKFKKLLNKGINCKILIGK